MSAESDQEMLDTAVIAALKDCEVSVKMGSIIGDASMKPLTYEGAQDVVDRLRARGFKVVRQ